MTIASAIVNKQQQVAACYTAISNKGGTLPATQDVANMPTAINSISTGGTIDSLTITPSISQQTITASGGTDGYSPITVNAVTSSIDANIQAGNIKSGVTILGVTGTYGGGSSKYGATINTFLGDIDANGVLQAPSEQSDVVFTGVTDIVAYALYYKFSYCTIKSISFPNLTTVSGNYGCYYMVDNCLSLTSVSFPNLTTVSGSYALYNMCYNCKNLTTAAFPNLTTVSGSYGCSNVFNACTLLVTVDLSNLTTVSGSNGCYAMLQNCTALVTFSLPKLSVITGSAACQYMFSGCRSITDIYFNALTTASFGSNINQFSNMFNIYTGATSGAFTMHFPSNLSSTISGLTGYPNFGATAGRLTLAFDLPATS